MTGALEGKVALVTGASRGIGRAIARRLAQDGALVVVHYGSNAAAANETVTQIERAGGQAFVAAADLTSVEAIEQMFQSLDVELGRRRGERGLDILVNNAGLLRTGGIATLSEADFDAMFATNVKGTLFVTKTCLPRLRHGGRIINLSSGTTLRGRPEMLGYAASKAAVSYIAVALAAELGPRGITVNTLTPGVIRTDMMERWLQDASYLDRSLKNTALGRIGEVDDIADVAAFLASDQARWVTGQMLVANGGAYL
jgi:NAD(P)-dependent dehydrogenase (short-subunit alcohol dehydrogenase family)